MSQNPYAATTFNPGIIEPPKTSVLAIISLVTGIVCCIPGLGLVASLLGSVALIRISGSGGRKSGTGLAVAGIVLGILASVMWVFIAIGAAQVGKMFTQGAGQIISSMQLTDANSMRVKLSPGAASVVTDARWAQFRSEIEAEIGPIQALPDGMIELLKGYGQVQGAMQSMQLSGRSDQFPVPVRGTTGWALMVIRVDQRGGGASPDPANINFGEIILKQALGVSVILPSGKEVVLFTPEEVAALPGTGEVPRLEAPKPDGTRPDGTRPDAPKPGAPAPGGA